MTVTETLLNFRRALLGVIAPVERVNIPWRRPDAYDEWDTIASALFGVLVVQILRWSLPATAQAQFRLPAYDLLLESYAACSVLEVEHPSLDGAHIFHAFGTRVNPFDVVEVRRISEANTPERSKLVQCDLEHAEFFLRLTSLLGGGRIRDVSVAR
jgi:hypothetical protein